MPARLAAWQAILERVRARTTAADGALRIELDDDVDRAELVRLAAAEHECCAFLSFAITVDGRGTGLEVRAPEEAMPVVTALFDAT